MCLEFKLNKLFVQEISLIETYIVSIDFNDILRIDLKSDKNNDGLASIGKKDKNLETIDESQTSDAE